MASCTLTSEFLNQQQHILPKRKIEELIKILEAVDNSEIVEAVIRDVGEGHHLKTFPDRKVLWDACMHNDAFKTFVSLVFNKWISLVRQCCKGREKYAKLQVKWMDFVRTVLHEPVHKHNASKQWSVVGKIDVAPSKSVMNAVISSVMRLVFNYSQQRLVAVKEGETLLLEHKQDDDCFIEAGMEIDEVSLYCLGGFALHSGIKAFKCGDESCERRQAICDVLKSLRLPVEEKVDLPPNIKHLDCNHTMTFMKKELTEYLFKVC